MVGWEKQGGGGDDDGGCCCSGRLWLICYFPLRGPFSGSLFGFGLFSTRWKSPWERRWHLRHSILRVRCHVYTNSSNNLWLDFYTLLAYFLSRDTLQLSEMAGSCAGPHEVTSSCTTCVPFTDVTVLTTPLTPWNISHFLRTHRNNTQETWCSKKKVSWSVIEGPDLCKK